MAVMSRTLGMKMRSIAATPGCAPKIGMLAFAAMLLLSSTARAGSIGIDDSFPPKMEGSLQKAAQDTWSIVRDLFRSDPPVNVPIVCHLDPNDGPKTTTDNWAQPTRFTISVTTGTSATQFAYQLAHELGHVMLNPARTNAAMETLCTALSYDVLDRLAQAWSGESAPRLLAYAPEFTQYRLKVESIALPYAPVEIRAAVDQGRWTEVGGYLSWETEEEIVDPRARDLQALGAMALRSKPIPWNRLVDLGNCTIPSPKEIPEYLEAPLTESCTDRVADVLCRAGLDCRDLIR